MINRLGKFAEPMVWPEVNINGHPYERGTGSLAHVGSEHFVVLPIGYIDDGQLEALRAEHAQPLIDTPKPTEKRKNRAEEQGKTDEGR